MFGLIIMKQKTLKELLHRHQKLGYDACRKSYYKQVTAPCLPVQEAAAVLWHDERKNGEL